MNRERFALLIRSLIGIVSLSLLVLISARYENTMPVWDDLADGTKNILVRSIGSNIRLPDSAVYQGAYYDGLFHGQGTLTWRNGTIYIGEFRRGLMHGRGRLTFSNGERYSGEFENGEWSGKGHYVAATGSSYKGEFKKDDFDGAGQYTEKNGKIFAGTFKQGAPNGPGTITFLNGSKYVGQLKDWRMSGSGTYTTAAGVIYLGEFVDDVQSGKGEIRWKSGTRYKGDIKNWLPEGVGEMRHKSGEFYQGEFYNNAYHGKGKLKYSNGDRYEGEFKNNLRDGKGTLVLATPKGHKKSQAGWWQYNQFVGLKKPGKKQKRKKIKSVDAESIFYRQPVLLNAALSKLRSTTPNVPDMYFVSFGAYGQQDVFMKEAQYSRQLFDRRFATKGRSLALINNKKTVNLIPIASVTNLTTTLNHVAKIMDTEEDILFLYLTSHGSKDHTLSVSMRGVPLNLLPAKKLARIIHDSGIKWKVIVVSSCYSGGFINALKDDYTLVITAARADHVSFGCSDEADFTFFGRAFFRESVAKSESFVAAFEQARILVREREKKENYDHSHPQIWSTPVIEAQLAIWRQQLPH